MKPKTPNSIRFFPPLRFDPATLRIYGLSVLTGLLSGIVVVAYRGAISWTEHLRESYMEPISRSGSLLAAWFFWAVASALVVGFLIQRSPLIKGSGIPQVKAYLMRRIEFDWKKELPYKFLGGVLALGSGLSLGREGPSIQLGALTGTAIDQKLCKGESRRYLVTAGAAAGISAAFNAPLAGVLFCVEELHRSVSPTLLTSTLLASFFSNAVMWISAGNEKVFPFQLLRTLPLEHYFSGVLGIGIAAGLLGSLFNSGLAGFQKAFARIVPNGRNRIVAAFAVAAGISLIAAPVTGGGGSMANTLFTASPALSSLALLLIGKLAFTLFSYASGAPGGIFLPMLSIGALVGALVHGAAPESWNIQSYGPNFILLGMAGFFVAVVRAPITGAVLITEMSGSFAHFPAFIFVSIAATATAELLGTRPIYDTLLAQLAPQEIEGEDKSPVHLHIPVQEECACPSCGSFLRRMPEGCILAAVRRGEMKFFPSEALELHPGDILEVVVEKGRASRLKSRLLALAQGDKE